MYYKQPQTLLPSSWMILKNSCPRSRCCGWCQGADSSSFIQSYCCSPPQKRRKALTILLIDICSLGVWKCKNRLQNLANWLQPTKPTSFPTKAASPCNHSPGVQLWHITCSTASFAEEVIVSRVDETSSTCLGWHEFWISHSQNQAAMENVTASKTWSWCIDSHGYYNMVLV